MAQQVNYGLRSSDVATDGTAQRFAEGAGQDIDINTGMRRRARAFGTDKACGVAVIDHHHGVIFFGEL